MNDHLFPARVDIPKANSGDMFFTPELMAEVQFMVNLEKARIEQIARFQAMRPDALISSQKLAVPKELWTTIQKELREQNKEPLSTESGEENQENQESSSDLLGQKGSDDDSSEVGSEPDDV